MAIDKYNSFNKINNCIKLQEEIEDLIEDNFPYLLDIMEVYTELYNADRDTMALDLEFFSKKNTASTPEANEDTWDEIKYEVATLIDYLKSNYGFTYMRLITSGDSINKIDINTYKGDITKEERSCVFRFDIKIEIDISTKEKSTLSKIKDFFTKK